MTIYYIPGITIKQESDFLHFELKLQKRNNNLLNKITELHSINVTLLLRRPYQTVFVLCNSKHTLAWVGGRKIHILLQQKKKKKSHPKFF